MAKADERMSQKLQNKLNSLYGRVQSIYDAMNKIGNDPVRIDDFLADSFTIDTLRNDFLQAIEERNEFQVKYEELPTPTYNSIVSFDQLYSRIKYKAHQLSSQLNEVNRNDSKNSSVKRERCAKLPSLEICSFDGNPELWSVFYESFRSIIHENDSLTDGEKIQYLVGKLKGKALNICQGILPSAENYTVLWNALISKYNDQRILAFSYLDKLFSLPAVKETCPTSLEEFIDRFSSLHAALKQLKIDKLEDFLFIYIAYKKMGVEAAKAFELQFSKDGDLPTCQDFIAYVRKHAHVMQRAQCAAGRQNLTSTPRQTSFGPRAASGESSKLRSNSSKTFINVQNSTKCVCCGKFEHFLLAQCTKFLSMTPQERFKIVKQHKLCVKCLINKHSLSNCKEAGCSECNRGHNSLLHFSDYIPLHSINNKSAVIANTASASMTEGIGTNVSSPVAKSVVNTVSLCSAVFGPDGIAPSSYRDEPAKSVLLGTAQCHVTDVAGNIHTVRCLIDSASQKELITFECCKRLNLQLYDPKNKFVSGVGDIVNPIEGQTCLTVRSRLDDAVRFTIQPLVVNRITNELPTAHIDISRLDYLNNIALADNFYHTPADIDIILGTDVFARILGTNTIARGSGEPVAIETLLGYVIFGQAPVANPTCTVVRTYCIMDDCFVSRINKFFEIEEVPDMVRTMTTDDQACEDYYSATTRRDVNGRYVVSLPFKGDRESLGDSICTAERRFISLERKLLKNPALKEEYDKVFMDYIHNNYIRPIGRIADVNTDHQYVIPHHAIIRNDKISTKVRPVLDGSCVTSSGKSLNDLLYTGPNLQNDLFRILLNFRLKPIAISADVRQMYLRVLVDDEDTRFQRLLYRFDPDDPITVFEMTRVPFGLCCSPYLAMRTVRQLAADERDNFPKAAYVAESDAYMDDMTTSCSSVDEGIELSQQLIKLFAAGGFELVKFASNSPEVMASIPSSHRVSESVEFGTEDKLKVLGLNWVPSEDRFVFRVIQPVHECTKRNILSTIARFWDLMGFVAPVILQAKLIFKSLWKEQLDWDDTPPQNIVTIWQRFEAELALLENVSLPRHIGINNDCVISILGFADASEVGYGGVVYVHVYFPATSQSLINLVCAKSKVAPSKTVITVARMELCANVILAKLLGQVIDTYSRRSHVTNVYAFTDSTVALAWIHSSPARWQTFVANRVSQIQNRIDPGHFYHIPGKNNPADPLSRGLSAAQLIEHPLWFSGPEFAKLPFTQWPIHRFDPAVVTDVPETKISVLTTTTVASPDTPPPVFYELASRVSSWSKLLRIVIYMLRFLKKLPRKFEMSHYEKAEEVIVKDVQMVHFPEELRIARLGGKLPPAFLKLNAFLKDGVLRVGGRLNNAQLDYDSQHPLLLPRNDHIVDLIIDHYHIKYLHTGPQLLMSLLRQNYWILSARNIVRKRVQLCNVCFKANPKNEAPMMASLPACRVQEAKAFCHTGVDYAGPLQIVPYRRRGVHSQKAYICLFVCLVTKAVHIELASDLSTDAFLNALKRFISRRGPVNILYSDCGTNFVGAKTYLGNVYQLLENEDYKDKFANTLRDNRIEWKFNPASAPHFGGLWESNVRSVKTHLTKVVGTQLYTFEEMLTVLTQIEAILNSRPLSILSSDPAEPLALTPAHFLVMTPLKSLPSENLPLESTTLSRRKRIVDSVVQSFWKRWKVEYLHTLQVRKKWLTPGCLVQTGTVVLLKSDNSAPLDWPLGVIVRTYPGADGITRVVDVKTKSGVYRRPVVKVFPLPSQ